MKQRAQLLAAIARRPVQPFRRGVRASPCACRECPMDSAGYPVHCPLCKRDYVDGDWYMFPPCVGKCHVDCYEGLKSS